MCGIQEAEKAVWRQRYFFPFNLTNKKATYLFKKILPQGNWIFHRCFWSKSQATFFFTLKAIKPTLIEIQGSNLVFIVTFVVACRVSQSCFLPFTMSDFVVFCPKIMRLFKTIFAFSINEIWFHLTNYYLEAA